MGHAGDDESFGQLMVDAERLVARVADHERGLASLEDRLEGDGVEDRVAELITTVQELQVGAQEQRRIAQSLRNRLAGAAAASHERDAPRRPLVLVVDDSKDNREVAALLLESSGFDAITASNGLEGLIAAHYTRPDVVLMDVAMPVLDGIQATRLLRASPATQSIHVIAHTARTDLDDVPLAQLFESVLAKPASPDVMLSVVQRYSGGANGLASPA
jgi:two-component system cell cycle response regulator DivK